MADIYYTVVDDCKIYIINRYFYIFITGSLRSIIFLYVDNLICKDPRNSLFQDLVGCDLQFRIYGQPYIITGFRFCPFFYHKCLSKVIYYQFLTAFSSLERTFHVCFDSAFSYYVIDCITLWITAVFFFLGIQFRQFIGGNLTCIS